MALEDKKLQKSFTLWGNGKPQAKNSSHRGSLAQIKKWVGVSLSCRQNFHRPAIVPLESKENDDQDGLNDEEGFSVMPEKAPGKLKEWETANLAELQKVNLSKNEEPPSSFNSCIRP